MVRYLSLVSTIAFLAACSPQGGAPAIETSSNEMTETHQADAQSAQLASPEEIAMAQAAPVLTGLSPFAPPHEAFTVIGNIHHVGGASVSAYLITTEEGHFLIDGILPQSPPMIIENIEELGFDVADVKYLLNSHAHIDHSGGLAGLQQASGATMVASAGDTPILESGRIEFGPTSTMPFPPVRVDEVIEDGGTLTLGDTTLTAVITPGHSPGCTSWKTETTASDGETYSVFFHCSTSLGGQTVAPESYPGMVDDYRSSFERIANEDADVFLAFHAGMFGMEEKYQALLADDALAFVDPEALGAFNAASQRQFEDALKQQEAALETSSQ